MTGPAPQPPRRPNARRSARGSATEHDPNDVNQRRAPARSSSRAASDQHATLALFEHHHRVVHRGAVEQQPGRDQDVEEPVVLEAVLAGVPDRVVQPGGALERGLPVERGVDPARERVRRRVRRRLQPAGAELQPQLGRRHLVRRREPARRVADVRELDVHEDLLAQHAFRARGVHRGHHPAGVAGQVVQVPERDLDARPGPGPASRRAGPGRRADRHRRCTRPTAGPPNPRTCGRSVSFRTNEPTSSAPSAADLAPYAAVASGSGASPGGKIAASSTRRTHASSRGTGLTYETWRTTGQWARSRRSDTPSTVTLTGNLYREELMGEEGFSSDSSLLYHRGVPSAIVASEVWELPDQSRTPNHPLKPRHLKLHELATDPSSGKDPVTGRRMVLGQQRRPDRVRRHRGGPVALLPQRDRRRVCVRRGRVRHRGDGARGVVLPDR